MERMGTAAGSAEDRRVFVADAAPRADGEACDADSQCESLDCDHDTEKCTTRALVCSFLDD